MTKTNILIISVVVISLLTNIALAVKLNLFGDINLFKKDTPTILTTKGSNSEIFDEINPTQGFQINEQ
ncbi:MAG: hypothetical protein UU16_C0023G0012 [Candidatus Woesebacteria bacterium GW2011_GWA2_40_7]|uniref:Uncharacterized protein n=1 Tax=Candidatus Woesebacteria bacterium GW2011_GWA2_40_7 TaxID=1618562 RepID=A0A0G0WDN7_9BACT|nr:MAG: hypothetical protein UU16_C0023G0012 [Candidatus Woesebacteria bacterium GW2011_GWA2_40_7]